MKLNVKQLRNLINEVASEEELSEELQLDEKRIRGSDIQTADDLERIRQSLRDYEF